MKTYFPIESSRCSDLRFLDEAVEFCKDVNRTPEKWKAITRRYGRRTKYALDKERQGHFVKKRKNESMRAADRAFREECLKESWSLLASGVL